MYIKTKRFLYNILKNRISSSQGGLIAVLGARKVGKTVLFKQLNEYFGNQSDYFDCTKLVVDETFDFEQYYRDCAAQNKKVIFLDEVCKIGMDYYADFIGFTKEYSDQISILITGSVSFIVEKYLNEIGRGIDIKLPQILYVERLCWDHGLEEIDLDFIKSNTSDEKLKIYLRNQMMNDKELIGYMKGVVQDTIESYRDRTYLEDLPDFGIDDNKLINALRYISLCQLIYKKGNGSFVDLPSIEKSLRDTIFENYRFAKAKYHLSITDIHQVVDILLGCGLVQKLKIITNLDVERMELADSNIPALLFEYPWFSNVCLSTDIQKSKAIEDQWIEYIILLRASYIYEEVDKCRINAEDEIDLIYLVQNKYAGVEIKNRPYANNRTVYLQREESFAKSLGLKDFIFSSSDRKNRNDKIVACLELEYINLVRDDKYFSDSTISELLDKYMEIGG